MMEMKKILHAKKEPMMCKTFTSSLAGLAIFLCKKKTEAITIFHGFLVEVLANCFYGSIL